MPKWVLVSGKVRFKKNSSSPSLPSSPTQFKEESGSFWLPINCISSVQFSHSIVSDSLRPHESQHARSPCLSRTPGVYSDTCTSSRWCHPAISSSVVPSFSCPQSLPASGSFPMSQLSALPIWCSEISAQLSSTRNPMASRFGFIIIEALSWLMPLLFALSLKLQCTPFPRSSFMELLTGSKSSPMVSYPTSSYIYHHPLSYLRFFPLWSVLGVGQPLSFIFHDSHLRVTSPMKLFNSSRGKGLFSPKCCQYSLHILV